MRIGRSILVGGFGLTVAWPAAAASDAGEVQTATVVVDQPMDTVRDVLSDAGRTMALSPDVLDVKTSQAGRCERVDVTTRGLLSPLTYVVLRCPVGAGFTEVLLESDDLDAYDVRWELSESGEGTRVTLRARVVSNLPVPQALVDSQLQKSIKAQLERVKALLGR